MNSRSFGALRWRCRSLSGERRGKTVSLKRLYFTSRCQILFGASINAQSIDTQSVAFWLRSLLAPPRVNLNHSYSNNYNWIFRSSWEKSIICFCLVLVSFDVFNEGPCGWRVCLDATFIYSLSKAKLDMKLLAEFCFMAMPQIRPTSSQIVSQLAKFLLTKKKNTDKNSSL